jgi:hypothetical protein
VKTTTDWSSGRQYTCGPNGKGRTSEEGASYAKVRLRRDEHQELFCHDIPERYRDERRRPAAARRAGRTIGGPEWLAFAVVRRGAAKQRQLHYLMR